MGINIIDFDGTVTDADKGHGPFEAAFREDVRKALGLTTTEFDGRWEALKRDVYTSPTKYGWVNQGVITVPAYADMFMETRAIGNTLLQQEGFSDKDADAVLYKSYKANYDKVEIHFKEGADDFLRRAEGSGNSFIVTNAYEDKVKRKMEQLERKYDVPVIGRANKHVLFSSWDVVPESTRLPDFDRDSYLRRALYGQLVQGLLTGTNSQPEDSKGLGDILEMDLLLLRSLGMETGYMPKSNTPQVEINAADNVLYSLEEAGDFLFKQ